MANEQIESTSIPINNITKKHSDWYKKRLQLYNDLITLAGINDFKLSDCLDDNLEYAMELILKYGTYAENAKAIRMYNEYFILDILLAL